jgi:spore germination cell wall hydrolase CwlJ-like protein
MNRTILALLFVGALAGAAQACGQSHFNASVQALYNPALQPVAEQTKTTGAGLSVTQKLDNSDIPVTSLNLAASIIASWTHKAKALFDTRLIQENCLTTAIYFEARSESQLGQLAVATVILNRVNISTSNSTICGVVYKGARHLNACQFSFACDGRADVVDDKQAWKTAREVTTLALAYDMKVNKGPMQLLATATNYHADYVDPVWSKSLNRLTKIGRHIFYSRTSLVGVKSARKKYI